MSQADRTSPRCIHGRTQWQRCVKCKPKKPISMYRLREAAVRLIQAAHELLVDFDEMMEKRELYPDSYAEHRQDLIKAIENAEDEACR